MRLLRLLAILMCSGWLALIPAKGIPTQEALSLNQILERAYQTEKAFKENLKDYICQATSTVFEPQKDGTVKTLNILKKTIYRKLPDKRLEKCTAITKDGRSLLPDEIAKIQKRQKTISLGHGRSFFGPEERAKYAFDLLPPDTVGGFPSYVLRIKPLQKTEQTFGGKVWLHQGNLEVVKLDLHPAKNPRFLRKANVVLDFSQVQPGIWLPSKITVNVQAGFLFIKKNRLIHETWSDFQINVGLPDSIFTKEE
jgi:hypothetical protein